MRRPRRIRTDPWFSFYHVIKNFDLSAYQIFSVEQCNSIELSTDHCFINCLRYFEIDSETIEFAKDIIRDILPLKHLNKICIVLSIVCCVSYVDEICKQHSPNKYGIGKPKIDLILMFEH
jgi:hypothetical protein